MITSSQARAAYELAWRWARLQFSYPNSRVAAVAARAAAVAERRYPGLMDHAHSVQVMYSQGSRLPRRRRAHGDPNERRRLDDQARKPTRCVECHALPRMANEVICKRCFDLELALSESRLKSRE